jgi:hypothetical protein
MRNRASFSHEEVVGLHPIHVGLPRQQEGEERPERKGAFVSMDLRDIINLHNMRCVDGRLYRHDPQADDPYLETDVGTCPDCHGHGCEPERDKQ